MAKVICEGYRRYGGAFSFGPVKWVACEEKAIVRILVVQDGVEKGYNGCLQCWNECIASKAITVIRAIPI